MGEFLVNWGTELILALIAAGITGYFKWQGSKLKKKLTDYEIMVKEQAEENAAKQAREKERLSRLKTKIKNM